MHNAENSNAAVVDRDETNEMISSEKVDGTAVYGRDRKRIGSVQHLMIGKRDGKVRYAVVSYGGFLGFGEGYFPVPWNELTHDEQTGGYVIDRDEATLMSAPRYSRGSEPSWNQSYHGQVSDHYRR